uniref:transposase n=1 Tax=Nocardioides sambongensis TaxID=2589074 RepID=UPI0018C884F4
MTANAHDSNARSLPTDATTRSSSPGCAHRSFDRPTTKNPAQRRRTAEELIRSLPTCPIPEIKPHGKTLKQWREAFLAYIDAGRASNGGTEAINGLSSSTAASPADSATAIITDYECCSSAAA